MYLKPNKMIMKSKKAEGVSTETVSWIIAIAVILAVGYALFRIISP